MEIIQVLRVSIDPHPKNILLYGEPLVDQAFLDHVHQFGIQQPITVMRSKSDPERFTSLGGHRRLIAAELLALKDVPCVLASPQNDDDELLLLVGLNFQRDKSLRVKVAEFLTLEPLLEKTSTGPAQVFGNKGLSTPSDGHLSDRTNGGKKGATMPTLAEKMGVTYREAIRIQRVFSDLYREGQFKDMAAKKAKQEKLEVLSRQWNNVRVECLSETYSLSGAEEKIYALIKTALKRGPEKPESKRVPPPTRHLLCLIDSSREFSGMGSFTSNKLNVEFGAVFFDMEQRPALRTTSGTYLIDMQELVDQHLQPMLKKS